MDESKHCIFPETMLYYLDVWGAYYAYYRLFQERKCYQGDYQRSMHRTFGLARNCCTRFKISHVA